MKLFLTATFSVFSFLAIGQSISPSIISVTKSKPKNAVPQDTSLKGLTDVIVLVKPKPRWLIPFTQNDSALAKAYDKDGSRFTGISTATIRPSIDGSNTNSVYVEFASYVASKLFRVSLGSNLVQSDLSDSTTSAQNIAFQKLTNGGGNLVLNLSRPIVYFGDIAAKKEGFFVSNLDLTGYSDIEALNKDIYNPGWGASLNLSFDMRIVNSKANTPNSQQGNLFRFGFNGRYQYNLFNEKYQSKNYSDEMFNNLGIFSVGTYFGLAMFNIQLTYNAYNKSNPFFDEKKWLLRVEVVPVKF